MTHRSISSLYGLLALTLLLQSASCARVEQIGAPRGRSSNVERGVFSVGWTHRVVPGIQPYRERANPIQGAVPVADVEQGRVFVGSSDHHFYCLDATTGRVLWRRDLGGPVRSHPLFSSVTQVVFVGTDDGRMLALGTDEGDERWLYQAEGEIVTQPVIQGEAMYFTSADNTVHALDWTNGELIWQHHQERGPAEFEVSGHAGVALSNRQVYTGFSDGTVAALDSYDGTVVWSRDLTEDVDVTASSGGIPVMRDVDTTPLLSDRRVFVASYEAGIYALDRENGAVVWREPTKSVVSLGGRGRTLVASQAGEGALALDTNSGEVFWRRDLGPATYYQPLIRQDLVVVADSQLGLTALSLDDGRVVQRFQVGGGVGGQAVIYGSTALVLSSGGNLVALTVR